jgi:hypothetical protein
MGPPGFRVPCKQPPFPSPGPHRGSHRLHALHLRGEQRREWPLPFGYDAGLHRLDLSIRLALRPERRHTRLLGGRDDLGGLICDRAGVVSSKRSPAERGRHLSSGSRSSLCSGLTAARVRGDSNPATLGDSH